MAETNPTEIAGSLVPVSQHQARLLLEAGYVWMDMQRFDRAKEIFSGAAALMPKSPVPQIALGTLSLAQGQADKALQAYRAAQRLDPRGALPRAHCGEALLFLKKYPEAVRELRAAIDLDADADGARLAASLLEAHELGAFGVPPSKP